MGTDPVRFLIVIKTLKPGLPQTPFSHLWLRPTFSDSQSHIQIVLQCYCSIFAVVTTVTSFVVWLLWSNDTVVIFVDGYGVHSSTFWFYYFDTVLVLTSEKYYFVWQRRKKCQKYCSKYPYLQMMWPYCLLTCTYDHIRYYYYYHYFCLNDHFSTNNRNSKTA